jgi:putative NIF3 family GTP cyclohydrolase 1 type 2
MEDDLAMTRVLIGDIDRAIAKRFPLEWAEEWDRVGLLAGDPDREVTGVVLALDPTREAIAEAARLGANVLVTHHPACLESPRWLTPGRGSAGVLFAAMDAKVALVNAHTNLDRAPAAGHLLPDALGLATIKPIERPPMPMSLVSVFVPASHAEAVTIAMTGAGAGRTGEYEAAHFVSAEGRGWFTPSANAKPYVGTRTEPSETPEVRVDTVAPRSRVKGVLAAARSAHPYEEPLIAAADVQIARASARMGMLCETPHGMTLGDLADLAARTFDITPTVYGDRDGVLGRVATGTGSVRALVGDALASGATALLGGEVRYHDALDAAEMGLSVIEIGHDVSEWPLVGLLEEVVRSVKGLDPAVVHVLPAKPAWWTPSI